jgi:hypothetical protein
MRPILILLTIVACCSSLPAIAAGPCPNGKCAVRKAATVVTAPVRVARRGVRR